MNQSLFSRDFLLLLAGQILSLLGNYTLRFALSMYVLETTGSAKIFGTILAVSVIPTLLFSPLGGVIADRLDRRWMMVVMDGCSGVLVWECGIALQAGAGLAAVAVLQIVLGILAAFESPTVQACVPQLQSGANLLRANAMVNQAQAIAGIVTPFTGSLLYVAFGMTPVMVMVGLCFFLTAFLECWIHLPGIPKSDPQRLWRILREDLQQSVHYIRKEQPVIGKLLLLAAAMNFFASGCITVGLPFLVRTELGLSATWYGAAESVLGGTGILGGLAVSVFADHLPARKMYWLLSIFGLSLLPPALTFAVEKTPTVCFGVLLVSLAIAEIGCSIFSVWGLCAIQERTPTEFTGKVMAFVLTISQCAQALAQFLYVVLWDYFSAAIVLAITGVLVFLIACLSRNIFRGLVLKTG